MNDPIFAWKVLSTLRLRLYREIFPYTSLLFAIRPKKQIDGFLTYPFKDHYVKGPLFWLKTIF